MLAESLVTHKNAAKADTAITVTTNAAASIATRLSSIVGVDWSCQRQLELELGSEWPRAGAEGDGDSDPNSNSDSELVVPVPVRRLA